MPENGTTTRTSARGTWRSAGRMAVQGAVVLSLYLLISLVFANWFVQVGPDRLAVIQTVYRNYRVPGGWGQSLRRFRELRNTRDVDILIAGSSHAYRSFDPRLFARRGLRAFNMGSTNQTPLNTYYLLQRFLPDLDPELLILELYVRTLSSEDGLESFFDLATNLPLSPELVKMAVATGQPHAVNSLVAVQMSRLTRPLHGAGQENIPDETYVSGGYCQSTEIIARDQTFQDVGSLDLPEIQMEYLAKVIRIAKERGTTVVMVTAPFPKAHRQAIDNYASLVDRIHAFARRHGVFYRDFNGRLNLETYTHFKDTHHLNHAGVIRFNRALLKLLQERGLLPSESR